MPDIVYIGRVKRVHESYRNPTRATVEPLVRSSEDRKCWMGSIEDPAVEFPPRGYVHWYDTPEELAEGDVRQFEVESHPYYRGEPNREALQVRNPRCPTEVVDLRDIGSERDIRVLLTTEGVFLESPLGDPCVLWVQDEKWVGPVDLVRRDDTGTWIVAPEQDMGSIRCWKISRETIQQVKLDGARYLLAPNQENPGQHIGFVNWEADEVLARRVFNHLLKQDRKAADELANALKISKDIFRTYVETIEGAGLIGSNAARELSFYERIKDIADTISQNEELLNEAANICFGIDRVKEKVAGKAEEEYQRKFAECETRLDKALATRRDELSRKEQELAKIEEQLGSLDKELEERVSGFETELEERLRVIAEKPERLFAEMAIANALVAKTGPTGTKSRVAVRRQITDSDLDIPLVDEPSDLMGALSSRLLSSRISPVVGRALHSILLAGLVPVLIGPEAYDVVSSYADSVSGGVLHWIPVGGSIFEPSDLLARFDPISRCLVPHPGGLLDLLLDESDALRVVVLEGFNRAAVDGYLITLLRSLQDVAKGRKPRSIPLAPPGFASEDDAYADVSRIAWNRRVLLMLFPSTGASTLPLPAEFWDYCAIVDAGNPAPEEVLLEPRSAPRITRVSSTVWKAWSEDAKEKVEVLEVLRKQPSEVGTLPSVALDNVERVYGSGVVLGLKQESAMKQAVRTSLFPYLVATEEPVDAWFQHLGITLNDTEQRIGDAVRRLG